MRPQFQDEDEQERKSTEVTLGLPILLALFLGLVIICGIFFGFGYSLGRGNAHSNNAANPTADATTSPVTTSLPDATNAAKPAPAQQAAPVEPTTASYTPQSAPVGNGDSSANTSQNAASMNTPAIQQGAAAANSYNQAQTAAYTGRPAPAPANATSPSAAPAQAESRPASRAEQQQAVRYAQAQRPAESQPRSSGHYMVQIAAMRRSSDAAILVNALRGRGYPAMTHYSIADGLTHVQIGPFDSYHAAHSMESRLMNDGYNAILER